MSEERNELYGGNDYDDTGPLYFDQHTLKKVRESLEGLLTEVQIETAINNMQNRGVLFRERGRT